MKSLILSLLLLVVVAVPVWADALGGPIPVVSGESAVCPTPSPSSDGTRGIWIGSGCGPSSVSEKKGGIARRRTSLALNRARRAQTTADRAEKLAKENADRNKRQAYHAQLSRDYVTTLWGHFWGDKGASDETRRVYRENGGVNQLLWGNTPPTGEEFKSFSDNGGLAGAILDSQSRLDRSRVSLWLVWLVSLFALVIAILARGRRQPEPTEETGEAAPPATDSPIPLEPEYEEEEEPEEPVVPDDIGPEPELEGPEEPAAETEEKPPPSLPEIAETEGIP